MSLPRACRFAGGALQPGSAFCANGLHRGVMPGSTASADRGTMPLTRQSRTRRGTVALTAEGARNRARPLAGSARASRAALGEIALGLPRGAAASLGRRKLHARAAGFRQTDGDGLLRRTGPMFALANMVNFLANKLARLR